MRLGDVCAAVVLDVEEELVAIYTDMSMVPNASYPAVIVKQGSLQNLAGGPVKQGERLAVAAFYEGDPETDDAWTDLAVFEPTRAATSNRRDIDATLDSIDDGDWAALEEWLKSQGNPSEPGVYLLEGEMQVGGAGVAEGRILLVPSDDEGMKTIFGLARQTFRFFLREWSWENRRIIPSLEFAAVKVAFSDPPELKSNDPNALEVEYMWVSDISFDGQRLRGTLLNQPDSLQSFNEGDAVSVPPKKIVDWAYSVLGEVCGGFTIQRMRLGMSKRELKSHDEAWGMDFGVPGGIKLVPNDYLPEELQEKRSPIKDVDNMFIHGSFKRVANMEHPMSVNMRESLEEQIANDASSLDWADDDGFTLLHSLAMAGSFDGVDVCLLNGADPNQAANNGHTPLKLAKQLGWKKIVSRLEEASAQ